MRFDNQQHRFYCGNDLHARTMHKCILDQPGKVALDKDLPCRPANFVRAVATCRDNLKAAPARSTPSTPALSKAAATTSDAP